jgi:hypothetical protein
MGVALQDSTQMRLTKDNEVVHAFTTDRPDQPFGESILPR